MSGAATTRRTGTRRDTSSRQGNRSSKVYDPPEGWSWCYIDEVMLDLSDRATPHNGPIPRYY